MRLLSLASGSTGNCVLIGDEDTNILIDAGITLKALKQGLAELNLSIEDINAVLLTHEHNDHVSGIGVLNRKHKCNIYSKKATLEVLKKYERYGKIDYSCFKNIEEEEAFFINDFQIKAFNTYHDAVDSVSYVVRKSGRKAVMLTDTGKFTEKIVSHLRGSDAIYVESNHDVKMLESSDYPYSLKMRIMSDLGHLSNEMTADLLIKSYTSKLKGVILGHLSRHNNMPEIAEQVVKSELYNSFDINEKDLPIYVAKINGNSEIINF